MRERKNLRDEVDHNNLYELCSKVLILEADLGMYAAVFQGCSTLHQ